jgi:hypothetical protein
VRLVHLLTLWHYPSCKPWHHAPAAAAASHVLLLLVQQQQQHLQHPLDLLPHLPGQQQQQHAVQGAPAPLLLLLHVQPHHAQLAPLHPAQPLLL